jgi:hypothetical protein
MTEPEKIESGSPTVTRGLVVFAVVFMVVVIATIVVVQNHPDHALSGVLLVGTRILMAAGALAWVTIGIAGFIKGRREIRRERAERSEGLNGPSNQR